MVKKAQVLVSHHIAVLNGPNLNLLGEREPEIYGRTSLAEIERATKERARALGVECTWIQTNHEGEFVEAIQGLTGRADGAVINAAAIAARGSSRGCSAGVRRRQLSAGTRSSCPVSRVAPPIGAPSDMRRSPPC